MGWNCGEVELWRGGIAEGWNSGGFELLMEAEREMRQEQLYCIRDNGNVHARI